MHALRHMRWFDRLLGSVDHFAGAAASTERAPGHPLAPGLLASAPIGARVKLRAFYAFCRGSFGTVIGAIRRGR